MIYDKEVLLALHKVRVICDGICWKRLALYLEEIVPKLERLGELTLDKETRCKLIGINSATIYRMRDQYASGTGTITDQAGGVAQASDPNQL